MYKMFNLDNGLKVVVENIDYVHSVSVGLWIQNGSRNENEINNGISHFLEHMLFKGTTNRSSKELAECIEDIGGQVNAFTGKESTCFYIKILDSYIELALDVLSDMLFNSKFSEEDIEKEKGVVIEEIYMSEDTPEDVLGDLQSKATWGEDSIALPILGTIDNIKSFTSNQLKQFVSEHYTPLNSVISISGNVDINHIEQLVQKYFGNWKYNKNTLEVYSTPNIKNHILYKKKNIEQIHLNFALNGVQLGNDDIYSLLLLNNIIGGGASSILFQKIREDMGICYSIYSYLSTYVNTGTLNIYAGLNPSHTIDAINIIKEEIDTFVKKGITEEKLIKAKEQVKGNYILGLESTSSRMFSNGKSVLFLNKINQPKDILEKINKIKMDTIHDVMDKTFAKGILNAAYVGDIDDFHIISDLTEKEIISYKNIKSIKI